jgi:hypothetical protein
MFALARDLGYADAGVRPGRFDIKLAFFLKHARRGGRR